MKKHMYKLLRKIYSILKSTDEQKALFHKLQAGDMVWAKMPLTNKELKKNVGDVIVKNNTQYYIYEEDNIFIYCLKIQKKKKEKLKAIIINRKTYYINFKDKISFRRNEKMKILNIANSDEILMIENQMNNFKKDNKKKIKNEIEYEEIVFDIGTVFEYGNSKVMYLYTDNHKYYGIDLLWYLIRPRIFEIKDIEKRQILEIKNIEVINKVIENLLEKDIKNKKKLEEVYEYIRSLLYYSIA